MTANKERFLAGEPFKFYMHELKYSSIIKFVIFNESHQLYCAVDCNDNEVTFYEIYFNGLVNVTIKYDQLEFLKGGNNG